MTATYPRRIAALTLSCFALLLAGCGKDEAAKKPAAPAVQKKSDPMVVELNAEMTKQFRVESAQMASIAISQKIAGRIEANEHRTTRIGASVSGRVIQVMAEEGDRVKAGQA
jgi:cobalt-zinc-cadmium efflux system membrane fusion protein